MLMENVPSEVRLLELLPSCALIKILFATRSLHPVVILLLSSDGELPVGKHNLNF
jgi:hypothetical protein